MKDDLHISNTAANRSAPSKREAIPHEAPLDNWEISHVSRFHRYLRTFWCTERIIEYQGNPISTFQDFLYAIPI